MKNLINKYSRFIALLAFAVGFSLVPSFATVTQGGNDNVYPDDGSPSLQLTTDNGPSGEYEVDCPYYVNFTRSQGGNCDAGAQAGGTIPANYTSVGFSTDVDTFWTSYMETFDLSKGGTTSVSLNYYPSNGWGYATVDGYCSSEAAGYSWGHSSISMYYIW